MAANRVDPRRSWRKPGVLGIPEGAAVERLLGELDMEISYLRTWI